MKSFSTKKTLLAIIAVAAALNFTVTWGAGCDCGEGGGENTDTGVPDVGGGDPAVIDGGPDVGFDAGHDAGHDAGEDGGFDAGHDAGHDGGHDAGHDAGFDAGHDAGHDAGCADGGEDGGGSLDGGVCVLPAQTGRLRIVNGCDKPIWIFYTGTDNSATFKWKTANASACTLNGSDVPVNTPTAGYTVKGLNQTVTYTLSCSGPGGPQSLATTVVVNPLPTDLTVMSFYATYKSASLYTLNIATSNATSCSVDNGVGNVPLNGTQNIAAPSNNTVYTLTCTGNAGSPISEQAVVYTGNPAANVSLMTFSVNRLIVTSGGNLINPTNQKKLGTTCEYIDYNVPEAGLAGMRFWPGTGCDGTGNHCAIGESGGPPYDGFTCTNCAPPIDSKFEGTFGCLSSVQQDQCQKNPSNTTLRLPTSDSWDTSQVDGFTLPYKVKVLDACPGGPPNQEIDCSKLSFNYCPTTEDVSTSTPLPVPFPGPPNPPFPQYGNLNLNLPQLANPGLQAGCYAPCSKLTMNNWNNNPGDAGTVAPTDNRAAYYCCAGVAGSCPTRTQTGCPCAFGPVVDTNYVNAIHQHCPNVYAYAYDDTNGLYSCTAGTRYEVTFYCPQ